MSVNADYPAAIRIGSNHADSMHIDKSGNKSLPPIHFSIFISNGHLSLFVTLGEAQEIASRINFVMDELVSNDDEERETSENADRFREDENPLNVLQPEDFEDTDQDPLAD